MKSTSQPIKRVETIANQHHINLSESWNEEVEILAMPNPTDQ
jgi:hypothetical protein